MHKLIIYAPNVASSGGVVLLDALIGALRESQAATLFLDVRARGHLSDKTESFSAHWFHSSLAGRLQAEARLFRVSKPGDVVLCFHNLPPIYPNRARIFCYVHNANLVGLLPTAANSGWLRFRYFFERSIAEIRKSAVERYIVQTVTMKEALEDWFGASAPPVDVLPFVDAGVSTLNLRSLPTCNHDTTERDFIYVSDGSPHKNHRRLFEAWAYLAEEGCYPSLAVTLDPVRNSELLVFLEGIANSSGARIENLGQIPRAQAMDLYLSSRALIFPSITESFGIPLLEAEARKLPILAPELDYVRDVCNPRETFDPRSARSIARSVKRFLGKPSSTQVPMSANDFVTRLMDLI